VRDPRQVNLALLSKWRWRYLLEDRGIWRDIISVRYGGCQPSPHLGGRPSGLRGVSSWWSNISLLGGDREVSGDWFSEGVARVIGNGLSTNFWHDSWCGKILLRTRFHRLFQLSLQQGGKVGELGNLVGSDWVWDLRWRRHLFVWETDLLHELMLVVTRNSRVNRDDRWSWTHSSDGRYSVKSAYTHLSKSLPSSVPNGEVLQAVSRVWKSPAPSKVVVFSWQLILDRIPTRLNLSLRGVQIPSGGLGCVFCDAQLESSVHLFLSCPSILPVWYQVSRWFGWEFVSPLGLAQQFLSFTGLGRGKRVRIGLLLVWHAVIWTIWTSRNDLIFSGGALSEEPVVDRAKLLAWKWFLAKCPASPCSFYEWELHPVLCWQR
jgi:hypothetical protein